MIDAHPSALGAQVDSLLRELDQLAALAKMLSASRSDDKQTFTVSGLPSKSYDGQHFRRLWIGENDDL